jgi:hypothetical protein
MLISPLRLISRPICRLIEPDKNEISRASSWLIRLSGGMPRR